MITRSLVQSLSLESLKRTLIVQTFRSTEALDTEYVIVEILQTDGTTTNLRAYVVDEITTMTAVQLPEDLQSNFQQSTPWPTTRVSGKIDILIGMEELYLHPREVEIVGKLGGLCLTTSSQTGPRR